MVSTEVTNDATTTTADANRRLVAVWPRLVWAYLDDLEQALHALSCPLTLVQYRTLRALEDGKLPMGEVARAVGCSIATMTGIINRLISAGLVERSSDANDRRIVYGQLTPAGHAALATARDRDQHLIQRAVQGIEAPALTRAFESMLQQINH